MQHTSFGKRNSSSDHRSPQELQMSKELQLAKAKAAPTTNQNTIAVVKSSGARDRSRSNLCDSSERRLRQELLMSKELQLARGKAASSKDRITAAVVKSSSARLQRHHRPPPTAKAAAATPGTTGQHSGMQSSTETLTQVTAMPARKVEESQAQVNTGTRAKD